MDDAIPPWRTPLKIVKQVDVSLPHCIKIMHLLVYLKSILVKITKILFLQLFSLLLYFEIAEDRTYGLSMYNHSTFV